MGNYVRIVYGRHVVFPYYKTSYEFVEYNEDIESVKIAIASITGSERSKVIRTQEFFAVLWHPSLPYIIKKILCARYAYDNTGYEVCIKYVASKEVQINDPLVSLRTYSAIHVGLYSTEKRAMSALALHVLGYDIPDYYVLDI